MESEEASIKAAGRYNRICEAMEVYVWMGNKHLMQGEVLLFGGAICFGVCPSVYLHFTWSNGAMQPSNQQLLPPLPSLDAQHAAYAVPIYAGGLVDCGHNTQGSRDTLADG